MFETHSYFDWLRYNPLQLRTPRRDMGLLESSITLRVFFRFGATPLFSLRTSIGVDCGDIDVLFEGQMSRGNSGQGSAKRVSRDEKLPLLSFLAVKQFYHVAHTASHPNGVHAVVEALPQARTISRRRESLDIVVAVWRCLRSFHFYLRVGAHR